MKVLLILLAFLAIVLLSMVARRRAMVSTDVEGGDAFADVPSADAGGDSGGGDGGGD